MKRLEKYLHDLYNDWWDCLQKSHRNIVVLQYLYYNLLLSSDNIIFHPIIIGIQLGLPGYTRPTQPSCSLTIKYDQSVAAWVVSCSYHGTAELWATVLSQLSLSVIPQGWQVTNNQILLFSRLSVKPRYL